MKAMHVVFRLDASKQIGSGHLMRCLGFAEQLKRCGHHSAFVMRDLGFPIREFILRQGYEVYLLPKPDSTEQISNYYPHSQWLEVSLERDCEESKKIIDDLHPNWIVIDHYGLGSRWEYAFRDYLTLAIDDTRDRPHIVDVLLDYNLGARQEGYASLLEKPTTLLIGSEYALLHPRFSDAIKKREPRLREKVEHILIYFGAADSFQMLEKIIPTILMLGERLQMNFQITAVCGSMNPHAKDIQTKFSNYPGVNFKNQVDDFPSLLLDADLAIGAGGVTTIERALCGVPSIIFAVAENQIPICIAAQELGIGFYIGTAWNYSDELLQQKFSQLCLDQSLRTQMFRRARSVVSSDGALNVVKKMEQLVSNPLSEKGEHAL